MNEKANENRPLLDIIKSKDLKAYLEDEYGHKFEADKTLCPFHADTEPSFSVFQKKEDEAYRWHCFGAGCEKSGSIIDYEIQQNNLTLNEAVDKLAKYFDLNTKPKVIAEYPYYDEKGANLLYTIKRWDSPKDGKKFTVDPKMEGKRRVLYRLSEILDPQNPIIFVTEGEKDVESLRNLGLKATTWPFGIGQWDKVDLSPLKGKNIRLCLDADVKREVVENIATAIYELGVEELKIIELLELVADDKTKKDITDWIRINETMSKEEQILALVKIAKATLPFTPMSDEILTSIRSDEIFTSMSDKILIKNAFLNEYVEIHSKITDAPQPFILFSGLALLSAALNHFYFFWPNRTFLNLYILLLAQSTTERKSTLIDMVHDYLEEIGQIAPEPTKLLFPSTFSLEAFFDILEERRRGIILWRELSEVKALFSKEYGKALPSKFTNIWDGQPISQQFKKEGFRKVDKPVTSILCGGIGEWLVEGLQKKDFQGGIWTRFIFVPAESRKKSYRLPGRFIRNSEITYQLSHLASLSPKEINLESVKPMIEYWMEKITEEKQILGDAIVETFYSKLEIQVVKIVSLLQLATDQTLIVKEETLEDAINIGEWIKRRLPSLLAGFQQSEWDRERARILKVLKRRGECRAGEIWQYANVDAGRGNIHLFNLKNEGTVDFRDTKPGAKGGRRGKIFFLIE